MFDRPSTKDVILVLEIYKLNLTEQIEDILLFEKRHPDVMEGLISSFPFAKNKWQIVGWKVKEDQIYAIIDFENQHGQKETMEIINNEELSDQTISSYFNAYENNRKV